MSVTALARAQSVFASVALAATAKKLAGALGFADQRAQARRAADHGG